MAVSRSVAALCGSAGIALFALSGTALAAPPAEISWSASLTGTSDYVFRGISQTDNDPTIQGSIGATYGMFYAGVWASGLDFGPASDAQIEVDYYAGLIWTWLAGINSDVGVIYYNYPGTNGADILELKAGVNGEIAPKLTAGVTYYYSPDYNDLDFGVVEVTAAYELPKTWVFTPTISGLYGNQQVFGTTALTDYSYWNAGLALAVDNLTFDLRYWDTDLTGPTSDERFVFSATLSLP